MKKIRNIILLLASVFTLMAACTGEREPVLSNSDRSQIRKIIEEETQAFANRDASGIAGFYSSDSISHTAWNNPNGTYGVIASRDSLVNNFKRVFSTNPARVYLPNINRSDWVFKELSPKWAWVNFTQTLKTSSGLIYKSHETRLLKKEIGGWKITVVNSLGDHGISVTPQTGS